MEVATRSNVYSKQEMEMVDLSDKGSSESEETNSGQTPDRVSSEGDSHVKTCADCGTTKTPLWRGGPSGPKSLCNACGIRSRKKRRALLGMNKEDKKSKKSTQGQHSNNRNSSISISSSSNNKVGNSVRRKLIAIPREASFQRPRPASNSVAKQWKRLGEEEEAAFLLMALSCGSVLA